MSNAPDTAAALRRPLWACAGAIVLLALAILFRGDGNRGFPEFLPSAAAQAQGPIAGGGGYYLMPGQLASNMWGVYLMDIETQSVAVYHYDAGARQLRLLAVREFEQDRLLRDFNTYPSPEEVRRVLELEQADERVVGDGAAD